MRWHLHGSWERSRLKRADSPPSRTLPSQAPEGFLLPPKRLVRRFEYGRPGSRGPRGETRVLRCAGPAGGNGARESRSTDGRANQTGFAVRRAMFKSAARSFVLKFVRDKHADVSGRSRARLRMLRPLRRGGLRRSGRAAKADGEDSGYFAPGGKRVRLPPLAARTVEAPPQGRRVAGSGPSPQGRACVAVDDNRFRMFLGAFLFARCARRPARRPKLAPAREGRW